MVEAILKGSPIYVRYSDNEKDSVVRETIGWLTKEVGDSVVIEHDRTVESLRYSGGSGNGIILPNSCILKKHVICIKGERTEAGNTTH